jgi:Nucleotidyl transferase AbiEii toxin, Type IV TA system
MEDLQQALTEAAAAMAQFRAHYALIGGMATSYRSQPRFTKDVDFLLNVPQLVLPPLLEDLQRRGFEFDTLATIREWTQHHMVVLSYRGIRIDWLKPVLPAYVHVLDRATEETWLNQPIRIASAEGLILLKLLAFRTQDQLDIENLLAAHRDTLDLDWIRAEWQTVTSLDDPRMRWLLECAEAEA